MDYEKEFLKIIENVSSRNRLSGSKGERNSFRYVRQYIEKNIGGKTLLQNFKILTWKEKSPAKLIIDEKEINCQTLYYSPQTKIKGILRFFGKDTEEDGNEFDVYCIKSHNRTIQAFLYVSQKYSQPFYYNKNSPTYLIPGVIIGKENLDFFQKNIGKKINLIIKSKYVVKKSGNLIHKLSNRKGRIKLIIGAHIDTIPDFKGIIDNATGVASALLISKELKKHKLPFDVWTIYFGAEENSMFGSKFFVDTLTEKEKENIHYMISIDGVGLGTKTLLHAEKDYESQLKKSFSSIEENTVFNDIEEMIDSSDHYYFKLLGIDSLFMEGSLEDFYYHSKEADNLDKINLDLSIKSILALTDFIKNIELQSPKIAFSKNKKQVLLDLYKRIFK